MYTLKLKIIDAIVANLKVGVIVMFSQCPICNMLFYTTLVLNNYKNKQKTIEVFKLLLPINCYGVNLHCGLPASTLGDTFIA